MSITDNLMFTVGSFIKCHTMHEEIITGEVLAFQYELKLMVLKSQSPSDSKLHAVTVVNLEWCKDVQIINESDGINASEDVSTLPEINLQKIDQRVKSAMQTRRAALDAYAAGVTVEGTQLYISLIKTFGSSVHLKKSSIIVKNVQVIAPYRPDCVVPLNVSVPIANLPAGDESLRYLRTLVDKFWRDQKADTLTEVSLSSSDSPSTSGYTPAVVNGGGGGGHGSIKAEVVVVENKEVANKTLPTTSNGKQQQQTGGNNSPQGKAKAKGGTAAAAASSSGLAGGSKSQPPPTRN